jgi:hypothetical protein
MAQAAQRLKISIPPTLSEGSEGFCGSLDRRCHYFGVVELMYKRDRTKFYSIDAMIGTAHPTKL